MYVLNYGSQTAILDITAFVEQLNTLNSSILDAWQRKTVSHVIRQANTSLTLIPTPTAGEDVLRPRSRGVNH